VEVNGCSCEREVEPRLLLSDFLRGDLGLTGTHVGCEHGVCGACTILFDGEPARSCIVLAAQAHGHAVQTIEGLASADGTLSPLQAAFRDAHGLQCGFCTPGLLMTVTAFLRDRPDPSESEVREVVSGHLCRCTGYQHIIEAVLAVKGPTDLSLEPPSTSAATAEAGQ
jgi:carbon-monoxide dehydrogenase small subunit